MKYLNLLVVLLLAAPAFADGNLRSARKLSRASSPAVTAASFEEVCSTVKQVSGREFLYKSQISGHISSGDPRSSGPTLICNRLCPSFPASFYYSDGTRATRVGYYGKWGRNQSRAYCAAGGVPRCRVTTLARNSRSRGRDGYLYLQTSRAKKGAGTVCYRVRPLGRTGNPN